MCDWEDFFSTNQKDLPGYRIELAKDNLGEGDLDCQLEVPEDLFAKISKQGNTSEA
jgi:hypothetical protein